MDMDIRKNQLLEVDISDVAYGGKGIVRIEGFAVFVDKAVPGDKVRIAITRKKKNYAEARIVELLKPSADRISAPCPHSGVCGGCKWQFLDYGRQLAYKRQHVVDSLAHIGLIQDVTVHPTLASELCFGYRNKVEFTCSDSPWRVSKDMPFSDPGTPFALGFHVPGVFHKVLDLESCLLQPDMGNLILGDIRRYLQTSDLPMYCPRTHQGFWRFVMLRHSVAHDHWLVNLITAAENRSAVQPLADLLTDRYPQIISVVNNITAKKAAISVGENEIRFFGNGHLTDRICGFEFDISANSFFQTNSRGAETLYRTVMDYAGLTGTETVFDLYCGTGAIAICLSKAARQVIGFEIVGAAVSDAEKNCRKNGVSNCTFFRGDIKDRLSEATQSSDVMIIDPPRDGMHKSVVQQVLQMQPERIVYVSCNPATLARDLGMMKDVYQVVEVQPVDMFPHTFHIESVAWLQKKGAGGRCPGAGKEILPSSFIDGRCSC
jgi:23S rRNA (uracil1939-C5)-methyltransferase